MQCFYYRGFTWKDNPTPPPKPTTALPNHEPNERTDLLRGTTAHERRGSDWSGLSPAVPHIAESAPPRVPTLVQTVLWNLVIVLMVIGAGVMGWWLGQRATRSRHHHRESQHPKDEEPLEFNVMGQFFGYLCAVAYIASRLPQLILNWRRKTTDGLSMLFFLFACLGNITYVLSILAYDPKCRGSECRDGEASRLYGKYMLVNLSWLAGSALTLFLDLGVFAQYFVYRTDNDSAIDDAASEDGGRSIDEESWDQRPLLERTDSGNRPR